MTNTTLSEVITATDLDLYHRNVTKSRKGEVQRKISLQINFIRDLYKNFGLVVVAGGAPMNHASGAPAADIDIFTSDQKMALSIARKYAFGPVESIDMSSKTDTASGYSSSINSLCLKFVARIPNVSGTKLVPVNVLVIKTPASAPEFKFREQVAAMTALSFPHRVLRYVYISDDDGELLILTPRWAAAAIPGAASRLSQSYLDKYFKKAILMEGNPNGVNNLPEYMMVPPRLLGLFRSDGNAGMNQYLGMIGFDTCTIFDTLFSPTLFSVSKRNYVTINRTSHGIFQTSLGHQSDDEVISRNVGINESYKAGSAARAENYSGAVASSFSSMLSLLRAANDNARHRAGSRSPDWIAAWGITPAVQPDRGEDTFTITPAAGTEIQWSIRPATTAGAGPVPLTGGIPTPPSIRGSVLF